LARYKVGVQIEPQHCSMADLRDAWRHADRLGADSIWTWDHFFPLWGGDPNGEHYEGWSQVAAMACDTERAAIGTLVSCNSYRNADLVADMARTIDHLSGGRVILTVGAGWNERDYAEYGYGFGTSRSRLTDLERGIERMKARIARLNPPPVGPLPLLIGGDGEQVTLRLVAQHADMWNGFGPVQVFTRKNEVLDRWCAEVGRDPSQIERTVLLRDGESVDDVPGYLDAGAQHLILPVHAPFDLSGLEAFIADAHEEG
jgi:probable F420-dependent oxidoreductase